MTFLQQLAREAIGVAVLFFYTSFVLGFGWYLAVCYESSAIRLERSVWSMIEFDKHFPPPQPGWEQCTSDPIPGEKDFVIKLCREGTPLK